MFVNVCVCVWMMSTTTNFYKSCMLYGNGLLRVISTHSHCTWRSALFLGRHGYVSSESTECSYSGWPEYTQDWRTLHRVFVNYGTMKNWIVFSIFRLPLLCHVCLTQFQIDVWIRTCSLGVFWDGVKKD